MMDSIGDTLLNAFAKIRKRDERFVEMRERVDRLEDNLNLLERTLSRTNKRSEGIIHGKKKTKSNINAYDKISLMITMSLLKALKAWPDTKKGQATCWSSLQKQSRSIRNA